tara:strand:- start:295 stop:1188 length:894 start_codon:yes stop_codon:yes gene_type:complete
MIEKFDVNRPDSVEIVEDLNLDALYQERKRALIAADPNLKQALAQDSDPLAVALRIEAYRELLLRQRINDVARDNLLAFTSQDTLERLGGLYGVERKAEENDTSYRLRMKRSINEIGSMGTIGYYISHAKKAHLWVKDARVKSLGNGRILVAILIDQDALAQYKADEVQSKREQVREAVMQYMHDPKVKMLTDDLDIVFAREREIDCTAKIYGHNLQPKAIDYLRQNFEQKFAECAVLGWDVSPSWIHAQLHTSDVHHVELNGLNEVIPIDDDEYAKLKLNLTTVDLRSNYVEHKGG